MVREQRLGRSRVRGTKALPGRRRGGWASASPENDIPFTIEAAEDPLEPVLGEHSRELLEPYRSAQCAVWPDGSADVSQVAVERCFTFRLVTSNGHHNIGRPASTDRGARRRTNPLAVVGTGRISIADLWHEQQLREKSHPEQALDRAIAVTRLILAPVRLPGHPSDRARGKDHATAKSADERAGSKDAGEQDRDSASDLLVEPAPLQVVDIAGSSFWFGSDEPGPSAADR